MRKIEELTERRPALLDLEDQKLMWRHSPLDLPHMILVELDGALLASQHGLIEPCKGRGFDCVIFDQPLTWSQAILAVAAYLIGKSVLVIETQNSGEETLWPGDLDRVHSQDGALQLSYHLTGSLSVRRTFTLG